MRWGMALGLFVGGVVYVVLVVFDAIDRPWARGASGSSAREPPSRRAEAVTSCSRTRRRAQRLPVAGIRAETGSVSSLAKTICRAALFIGLLVASSHVDVAAAYWQSGGTSTGAARVAQPLTVNQTADLGPVGPGAPAQTLSGTFDNRNGHAVHVSTMRVSIAKVIKARGAAAGSCDASDFTLTHRTIDVAADVPAGAERAAGPAARWPSTTSPASTRTPVRARRSSSATRPL